MNTTPTVGQLVHKGNGGAVYEVTETRTTPYPAARVRKQSATKGGLWVPISTLTEAN